MSTCFPLATRTPTLSFVCLESLRLPSFSDFVSHPSFSSAHFPTGILMKSFIHMSTDPTFLSCDQRASLHTTHTPAFCMSTGMPQRHLKLSKNKVCIFFLKPLRYEISLISGDVNSVSTVTPTQMLGAIVSPAHSYTSSTP